MDIVSGLDKIQNKEQLSDWTLELREDLRTHPDEWGNNTLENYLEAMANWIKDSDGYYHNRKIDREKRNMWKQFADILIAGSMYD